MASNTSQDDITGWKFLPLSGCEYLSFHDSFRNSKIPTIGVFQLFPLNGVNSVNNNSRKSHLILPNVNWSHDPRNAGEKTFFNDTFAIYLSMDTSQKLPLESDKSFI